MGWWLFLIPVFSAFSCWLIIKVFFTILFHPYRRKSILGLQLQGILPAKQVAIASKTGKLVAEQFFSVKEIEEKVTDPANLQKIMPAIEEQIDDFLRNKLKKRNALCRDVRRGQNDQLTKKSFYQRVGNFVSKHNERLCF
jgi:uncharacterized membrane protein YheB (UPF0754 family)